MQRKERDWICLSPAVPKTKWPLATSSTVGSSLWETFTFTFLLNYIQKNSSDWNTFGTMKICSSQGYFKLMSVNHSTRPGGIIGIYFQFCLACEAEARHMYCFSGVVVVVVVVVGVNFLCLGHFLRNYKG